MFKIFSIKKKPEKIIEFAEVQQQTCVTEIIDDDSEVVKTET